MTTKTKSRAGAPRARKSPKVDVFIRQASRWREELTKLRALLLGSGLSEDLKWGKPCYSFGDGNVVIVLPLKHHCALMFFKGSLLTDPHGLLVKPGENSQAGRQIRLTSRREIEEKEPLLKEYLAQAIDVEKSGRKVDFAMSNALVYPKEFQVKLDRDPRLRAAFDAFTPGRRRAYNLHFSGAKQSQTRESRIEKCIPRILAGRGIDDH